MEEKKVDTNEKSNINDKDKEVTSKTIKKLLEEEGVNPEGAENYLSGLGCTSSC